MPDTGAPWNIPYVASTDLVSDWPTDSLALANAIDAGLDAANVGIGSNVVQTVKTDTFTTSSATFTTVTGMTATITPTSNTSKVLVIAQLTVGGGNASHQGYWKVTRGGTDIYIGDAAGSRVRTVFGGFVTAHVQSTFGFSIVYLDTPATTSATTYQIEGRRGASAQSVYLNRSITDTDNADFGRGASSITLIEVAA